MNKNLALSIVGGLSAPSKMPCYGYSISALRCITGKKLAKIANSICSKCYALRGNYRYSNVQNALEKRYHSLSNPQWVKAMAWLVNNVESSGHFRWHDSGDIQSVEHLEKIVEVCNLTPGVKHWLPTREYCGYNGKPGIIQAYLMKHGAFPANLIVRLSALMIDAAPPVSVAKRLGLHTSGVCTTGFTCPASTQGNECLKCRACWDKNVPNVNYKRH